MREPVTLSWAGGRENAFLLRTGEMISLEKACDAGIGRILTRLMASLTGAPEFYVFDIQETLRLGLIGGGMERGDAAKTVSQAAEWHGLLALAPTALGVLTASLRSAADDVEDEPDSKKKPTSTDGSMNLASTATVP